MRFIKFGNKFDPNRGEIVNLMGPRELILVALAAGQAIWFLFMLTSLAFVVRLTLAGVIGLALLAIALVPIKDKPIEWHVVQFIRYKLRPARRIYQTALRKPIEVAEIAPQAVAPVAQPKPIADANPRTKTRANAGAWRGLLPDTALVLAAFACLIVVGSMVAFAGKGGRFELASVARAQSSEWR